MIESSRNDSWSTNSDPRQQRVGALYRSIRLFPPFALASHHLPT